MPAHLVKHIGTAVDKTSGTVLTVTVPAGGVAIGMMLWVRIGMAGNAIATVTDTRGNTYTDPGHGGGTDPRIINRLSQITTALVAGDTITITYDVAVTGRVVVIDEFYAKKDIRSLEPGSQSSTSTTPTTGSVGIVQTGKSHLWLPFVVVEGPTGDTFTEDADAVGGASWTGLTRAGTTGGADDSNITVNSAYKVTLAASIDAQTYNPTLGTSRAWLANMRAFDSYDVTVPRVGPTAVVHTPNIERRVWFRFYQRPVAHDPITDWTVTGATTHANAVNEVVADDADYVEAPTGFVESNIRFTLVSSVDASGTINRTVPHFLRYRFQKNLAGDPQVALRVNLFETSALAPIASFVHTNIQNGWTTVEQQLTAAQVNAIQNYNNLKLEFVSTVSGPIVFDRLAQVSWTELAYEIPALTSTVVHTPNSVVATPPGTQAVFMETIGPTSVVFTPAVDRRTVTPDTLGPTSLVFAPAAINTQVVEVPLLGPGTVVHDPIALAPAGTGQFIIMETVAAATAVFSPIVDRRTVTPEALGPTSVVFAPTAVNTQLVEVPLLASGTVVRDPIVLNAAAANDQFVLTEAIGPTSVVFAPTAVNTQLVVVPLLGPTSLVNLPVVDLRTVTPAALGPGTVVRDPIVINVAGAGQFILMEAVAAATAVHGPARVDQTVNAQLHGNPVSVHLPGVEFNVLPPLIAATTTVHAPARIDQTVNPPTISGTVVHAPASLQEQCGRPDEDITTGTWTTTPLFAKIDEEIADDADFIQSAVDPAADTCEVGLSDIIDPLTSADHKLTYRFRKDADSGTAVDLTVTLLQGAIPIATFTHTNISATFTTVTQTLTTVQADAITDYKNLRIRFSATEAEPLLSLRVQVSYAAFCVPGVVTVRPPGIGPGTVVHSPLVSETLIFAQFLAAATAVFSPATAYQVAVPHLDAAAFVWPPHIVQIVQPAAWITSTTIHMPGTPLPDVTMAHLGPLSVAHTPFNVKPDTAGGGGTARIWIFDD